MESLPEKLVELLKRKNDRLPHETIMKLFPDVLYKLASKKERKNILKMFIH